MRRRCGVAFTRAWPFIRFPLYELVPIYGPERFREIEPAPADAPSGTTIGLMVPEGARIYRSLGRPTIGYEWREVKRGPLDSAYAYEVKFVKEGETA